MIGVGQFTVIDDKLVEEADLGANFFLDEESLGKPRAERAAALLGELNPDVKGNYLVDVSNDFRLVPTIWVSRFSLLGSRASQYLVR